MGAVDAPPEVAEKELQANSISSLQSDKIFTIRQERFPSDW
jgi:hypothetical protein